MKEPEKQKRTDLKKLNLKNKNAITLIALVVTIVVLLILAGVTISLLLDENGIIAKSKDARLENRASQVEDEIGMWKQNNFINKESNQAQEEADTILESLIFRKLLTEDEIDREQRIITIKKKDGSILKEINYSSVTINISKNPETEKSGAVLLTIESVEGMTMPKFSVYDKDYSEVINYINTLSEAQKKEIIKNYEVKSINEQNPTANCKNFEDVLEWAQKQGINITEEDFWESIKTNGDLDTLVFNLLKNSYYNEETMTIEGYTVTNPDGEISSTYAVTENGTYTFEVQDIITGEIYTKKVEVTNIDKTKPAFAVVNGQYHFIWLLDIIENEYISFEKAYIMYNNEKIDITSTIDTFNGITEISQFTIFYILKGKGLVDYKSELIDTNQTIILVKDDKEYTGIVNMGDLSEPV